MTIPDEMSRRVFDEIERVPSPDHVTGECWEWTGSRGDGYGAIHTSDYERAQAHRVAAKLEIDPSLELNPGWGVNRTVNHRCANPPCVNPDHLYVGTHSENMDDAFATGDHATASLTPDEVVEIRERCAAEDVTQTELADEFDVDTATVSNVVRGKSYPSFGGPRTKGNLTPDEAAEIRERYANEDVTQTELADEFGVTGGTVCHIVHGDTHKDAGGPIVD